MVCLAGRAVLHQSAVQAQRRYPLRFAPLPHLEKDYISSAACAIVATGRSFRNRRPRLRHVILPCPLSWVS